MFDIVVKSEEVALCFNGLVRLEAKKIIYEKDLVRDIDGLVHAHLWL